METRYIVKHSIYHYIRIKTLLSCSF